MDLISLGNTYLNDCVNNKISYLKISPYIISICQSSKIDNLSDLYNQH